MAGLNTTLILEFSHGVPPPLLHDCSMTFPVHTMVLAGHVVYVQPLVSGETMSKSLNTTKYALEFYDPSLILIIGIPE